MTRGSWPAGRPDGDPPGKYIVWAVVLLGAFAAAFIGYLNLTGRG